MSWIGNHRRMKSKKRIRIWIGVAIAVSLSLVMTACAEFPGMTGGGKPAANADASGEGTSAVTDASEEGAAAVADASGEETAEEEKNHLDFPPEDEGSRVRVSCSGAELIKDNPMEIAISTAHDKTLVNLEIDSDGHINQEEFLIYPGVYRVFVTLNGDNYFDAFAFEEGMAGDCSLKINLEEKEIIIEHEEDQEQLLRIWMVDPLDPHQGADDFPEIQQRPIMHVNVDDPSLIEDEYLAMVMVDSDSVIVTYLKFYPDGHMNTNLVYLCPDDFKVLMKLNGMKYFYSFTVDKDYEGFYEMYIHTADGTIVVEQADDHKVVSTFERSAPAESDD